MSHRPLSPTLAVRHAEQFCKAYVECEGGCGKTLEGCASTPGQARCDLRAQAKQECWVLVDLGSEGAWPRCPACAEDYVHWRGSEQTGEEAEGGIV